MPALHCAVGRALPAVESRLPNVATNILLPLAGDCLARHPFAAVGQVAQSAGACLVGIAPSAFALHTVCQANAVAPSLRFAGPGRVVGHQMPAALTPVGPLCCPLSHPRFPAAESLQQPAADLSLSFSFYRKLVRHAHALPATWQSEPAFTGRPTKRGDRGPSHGPLRKLARDRLSAALREAATPRSLSSPG